MIRNTFFTLLLSLATCLSCSQPTGDVGDGDPRTTPEGNGSDTGSNTGGGATGDAVDNSNENADGNQGSGDIVTQKAGRIVWPDNNSVPKEGLRVLTGSSEQSPDADGTFALASEGAGLVFTLVVDGEDDPVLMAFADVDSPDPMEINAHESAAVLVFMALGAYTLPPAEYANVLSIIRNSSETDAVTSLIERRLESNPKWLTEEDLELQDLLRSIAEAGRSPNEKRGPGTTLHKAQVRSQAMEQSVRVLSNPHEASGIRIDESESSLGVTIVNRFRRHVKYFVYKTGYMDENDMRFPLIPVRPAYHTDGTLARDVLLEAVQSFEGLFGSAVSALRGNVAWQERPSKDVRMTLPEGEKQGYFEVIVCGPSRHYDESTIPAWVEDSRNSDAESWISAQRDMTYLTVGKEIVLPALFSVLVPAASLADGNVESDEIVGLMRELIRLRPELKLKIDQGQLSEVIPSVLNALADNPGVRELILDLLHEHLGRAFVQRGIYAALDRANNLLAAIDIGLTVTDLGSVILDVDGSNAFDRFEVTVIPAKVEIDPNFAELLPGDSIDLTVQTTTTAPEKYYLWETSGLYGRFVINGVPYPGNAPRTETNTITYELNSLPRPFYGETDFVSVQVWRENLDGGDPIFVGDSNSRISTALLLQIEPPTIATRSGETHTFGTVDNFAGEASYLWSTTGTVGILRDSSGNSSSRFLDTLDRDVDVVARDNLVFGLRDGIEVTLLENGEPQGSAQAQVGAIENRRTMIQGSLVFRDFSGGDGVTCCQAGRVIPKVENAVRYTVHIHNYVDTLNFWATEHTDFIDPANPRTRDGGGKATPQVDEGSSWYIGLSGACSGGEPSPFCNQLRERFSGMIIDVTVDLSE